MEERGNEWGRGDKLYFNAGTRARRTHSREQSASMFARGIETIVCSGRSMETFVRVFLLQFDLLFVSSVPRYTGAAELSYLSGLSDRFIYWGSQEGLTKSSDGRTSGRVRIVCFALFGFHKISR